MPALVSIPEHAHCEICQVPVKRGDRRCGSPECEAKFQQAIKAKKRSVFILMGVLVAAMLLAKLL